MDALSRPTVYSRDQKHHIQNSIDRAIASLTKLKAAYEAPFICQTLEGEHYASKDLLSATESIDDAFNQLQFDLLEQVSKHLGDPRETFDLVAIKEGNEAVNAIRSEYAEQLSKFLSMEAA